MIRRLLIMLAVGLVLEAVAFVVWNRDLVVLSRPVSALSTDPAFDAAAHVALGRPRVSRRLLVRVAEAAQARSDRPLRLEALRRLAVEAADDAAAQVNFADALREVGRHDEADAVYGAALRRLAEREGQ